MDTRSMMLDEKKERRLPDALFFAEWGLPLLDVPPSEILCLRFTQQVR